MYIFFILTFLHDPTSCRALISNRAEIKAVCLSVCGAHDVRLCAVEAQNKIK